MMELSPDGQNDASERVVPHSDGPGLNFSLTVFHLTLFSIVTSDEEFHLGEWARFPSKTKREGEAESLMFKILIRVI